MTVHQFKVRDTRGNQVDLSQYKGKVLLIVNTASECGFTPQFSDLEALYQQYKNDGFEILGFPSNQFSNQEPLEGEALNRFCEINYGVSFPVFDKVNVKGEDAIPLFQYLSDKKQNQKINSTPKWNFHKYLVDKNGQVVDYFYTTTKPTSKKIKRAIEKLL